MIGVVISGRISLDFISPTTLHFKYLLQGEGDLPDHFNKPVTDSLSAFLLPKSAAIWKQLIKVVTCSSSLHLLMATPFPAQTHW